MSGPIVYVDRSTIRDGKLDTLRSAMDELAEFVESEEPQLISYGFYIDGDASRMTVVAIHPDSASLEYHMDIGGSRFRGFSELIHLLGIDVYGQPSDTVLEQLEQKAEMLGAPGGVGIHRLHAGFMRITAPGAARADMR